MNSQPIGRSCWEDRRIVKRVDGSRKAPPTAGRKAPTAERHSKRRRRVHDAESAHLRITTTRRGARRPASCCACELPSLANSHARVRGRVTFVAVAEFHGTPSSRQLGPEEKSAFFCPSPIARLFFCPVLAASHLLAAAGSFTPAAMPLLIFLRALFFSRVDRLDRGTRTCLSS